MPLFQGKNSRGRLKIFPSSPRYIGAIPFCIHDGSPAQGLPAPPTSGFAKAGPE